MENVSLNSTEMFHSSSNRPGPEGRTHSEIRMMTMFSITKSSCLGIEITSYKLFPWNFSFLSSCLCKKWENCKLNGNKWKSRWEEIERLREGEKERVIESEYYKCLSHFALLHSLLCPTVWLSPLMEGLEK